jgi:F0F1-type ATP synthase epsilon subunit
MDIKEKTEDKKELEAVPEGKMIVKVYAPFRNYFEGPAASISAVNDTGPFDILPGHHKFLTLLSACELDIRSDIDKSSADKIKIDKGIMFVKEDRVVVFLDV